MPRMLLFSLTCLLLFAQGASAHPGRLDKAGCHHDTKTGGYHCHQGHPPSGQQGSGQEDQAPKQESGGQPQTPPAKPAQN